MGFAFSNDLQLSSSAFEDGGAIPTRYTGEGEDVSPALSWSNAPEGTKSFAVVCHDPDAPLISPNGTYGFVHWVLYNIPADIATLEEGTRDFTQGKNNFGKLGFNGPMPPEGHGTHRYYFWVLALDANLHLPDGMNLWELLAKLERHTLAMNRLVGTYQRG
jgi:Raf kinase inhibitor-like YbhB/YbcL family protein